jgi:hypothetical protein
MKKWYQSKTILLNMFVAILAVFEASTGLLKPFVPDYLYVTLAVSLPILNIILRTITTQSVTK